MQNWSAFYSVIATAAAALMGLLFVAVSLNAAQALGPGHDGSRRMAEQAFQNYVAVLLVSLLALFPGMSLAIYGRVTLAVTAVSTFWVLARLYLTLAKPDPAESRWTAPRRHLSSLIGFGLLITAAARMALNLDDDRNLLASAALVLLISATLVSWELLARLAGRGRAPT